MLILSGKGHSAYVPPTQPLEPPIKPIKKVAIMEQSEAKPLAKLEPVGYPLAPQGTYASDYEWGNCTWYVASRKRVPNSMGDANKWASYLGGAGYKVSQTPVKGAIAQSTSGYWGHVAIVEDVDLAAGLVYISEMNVEGLNVVSYRWYSFSHFDNYIYL